MTREEGGPLAGPAIAQGALFGTLTVAVRTVVLPLASRAWYLTV